MMSDNMDIHFDPSVSLSLTVTFDTKEEVMQLLDSLDKNSGVSKGDVWIFPPQADDLALTGNDF